MNEGPIEDSRQAHLQAADAAVREALLNALVNEQFEEAAAMMVKLDFWLLSADESEQGNMPIVLSIEGIDAMAVFTSLPLAQNFCVQNPELTRDDGSVPAFAIGGANLLEPIVGELGLLLDIETDEAVLVEPGGVADLHDAIKAGG